MTEPVIITSNNNFETIVLDQPTQTVNYSNTNGTQNQSSIGAMGNAMLETMKSTILSKMSTWKDERFQSFRPVSEFFNRSKISLPKPTEVVTRVKQNLIWYQTNYLAVFCILALYCALTSPMFLISVILTSGVWIWSYKYREGTVRIQGKEVPENMFIAILSALTLFIFYIADVSSILIWLLMITSIFSLIHAIILIPQPQDEYGFGVTDQRTGVI